jgi:hypothetical protein
VAKFLFTAKDGGPESLVVGYWLIEWKKLFSIVLLRFDKGSRETYHSHAFNAISWVLWGRIEEHLLEKGRIPIVLSPSILPVITKRSRFHKVYGIANKTWVISFRGPWSKYWKEYKNEFTTLTNGRIKVE